MMLGFALEPMCSMRFRGVSAALAPRRAHLSRQVHQSHQVAPRERQLVTELHARRFKKLSDIRSIVFQRLSRPTLKPPPAGGVSRDTVEGYFPCWGPPLIRIDVPES